MRVQTELRLWRSRLLYGRIGGRYSGTAGGRLVIRLGRRAIGVGRRRFVRDCPPTRSYAGTSSPAIASCGMPRHGDRCAVRQTPDRVAENPENPHQAKGKHGDQQGIFEGPGSGLTST